VFAIVTFLHDLFTAVWIGGVITLGITVLPSAKKVLGNGLLGAAMGLAETFEPIVRLFGNAARSPLGERMEGIGKRGVTTVVTSCPACWLSQR